jgi:hypothetical protein
VSDECVGALCGKWKLKRASSDAYPEYPTEPISRIKRSSSLRGFRNMKPYGASDECAFLWREWGVRVGDECAAATPRRGPTDDVMCCVLDKCGLFADAHGRGGSLTFADAHGRGGSLTFADAHGRGSGTGIKWAPTASTAPDAPKLTSLMGSLSPNLIYSVA